MKHNMNRVLSIVALLRLTIGAWADAERVNITLRLVVEQLPLASAVLPVR